MEITDPSLGTFSVLPPEIRRMIWKHFTPYLYINRSLPREPDHLRRAQRLLLASRKIFTEVAAEVPSGFNGGTIHIAIHAEYKSKSWIRVENNTGIHWYFKDVSDAISRGFCELPWHELKVKVYMGPPDKKDSGQILCLYHKVRALVEIFKAVKGFQSLRVVFRDMETTSWFDQGQPQRSIGITAETRRFNGGLLATIWDYHYILPLFFQVRNVKRAEVCAEYLNKVGPHT